MAFEKEKQSALQYFYEVNDNENKKGLSGSIYRLKKGRDINIVSQETEIELSKLKTIIQTLLNDGYLVVTNQGRVSKGYVEKYEISIKGIEFLEDGNTFESQRRSLEEGAETDKKVKTSTIKNNVWSIRIGIGTLIISMCIAAIPICVNRTDNQIIRAKLDSLSSEVSFLKKTNEQMNDSIKALHSQKYTLEKKSNKNIAR